jgi:hypothetical protein
MAFARPVISVGLSLLLSFVAGCGKNEECEKARLAAASSWEGVKQQAGKFKFSGVAGFESAPTEQKAEHHKAFAEIETQAGLVFDSFAFQQITWTAAKNGRDKVQKAFDGYRDKDKYSSFSSQLQSAYQKYDAAEAACR